MIMSIALYIMLIMMSKTSASSSIAEPPVPENSSKSQKIVPNVQVETSSIKAYSMCVIRLDSHASFLSKSFNQWGVVGATCVQ